MAAAVLAQPIDRPTSTPAKQSLDIRELQLDIGRAAMIALSRVRRRFHLAQKCIHLLCRQAAAGADAEMAGERGGNMVEALLQRGHGFGVGELVGEVAD